MYRMRYEIKVDKGQFKGKDIQNENQGLADALVFISIVRGNENNEPHEGSKAIQIITVDSREGEVVPETEIFQVFAHMANQLSEYANIPDWQREIAKETFEKVRAKILERRKR